MTQDIREALRERLPDDRPGTVSERDWEVLNEFAVEGAGYRKIAGNVGITTERVRQIVFGALTKPGEAGLPADEDDEFSVSESYAPTNDAEGFMPLTHRVNNLSKIAKDWAGYFPDKCPEGIDERNFGIARKHIQFGVSYRDLAAEYGVSQERIRVIINKLIRRLEYKHMGFDK